MAIRFFSLLTLAAMLALTTGCGLFDSLHWAQAPGDQPQWVQDLAALQYPGEENKGESLDIIVEQQGDQLKVTNVAARGVESFQLWLNQQYVTVADKLAPGQTISLPMSGFINQYGEAFPTGSFLSPDKARPLVSADLYDPRTGQLHAVTVRTKTDIFGR